MIFGRVERHDMKRIIGALTLTICACGSEETQSPPTLNTGLTQGNSQPTSTVAYTIETLDPVIDTETSLPDTGELFMVQGEVLIQSVDYCTMKAKVSVQTPGSSAYKAIRNFYFRAGSSSWSYTRESVSFALPKGSKFKIHDIEVILHANHPEAPCLPEHLKIGTFTAFKMQ